jgi:hypothetical protein
MGNDYNMGMHRVFEFLLAIRFFCIMGLKGVTMENIWQPLVQGTYLILVVVLICIPLWTTVWAYRDANSRGKPGFLVALMVLVLVWPIGLLFWLITRPDKPDLQIS